MNMPLNPYLQRPSALDVTNLMRAMNTIVTDDRSQLVQLVSHLRATTQWQPAMLAAFAATVVSELALLDGKIFLDPVLHGQFRAYAAVVAEQIAGHP